MNKNERFALKRMADSLASIGDELAAMGNAKEGCLARLPEGMKESPAGRVMESEAGELDKARQMSIELSNFLKEISC